MSMNGPWHGAPLQAAQEIGCRLTILADALNHVSQEGFSADFGGSGDLSASRSRLNSAIREESVRGSMCRNNGQKTSRFI
jgi:hypothetical protein